MDQCVVVGRNVFDSKSLPVRKSESIQGSEERGDSWEGGEGGS